MASASSKTETETAEVASTAETIKTTSDVSGSDPEENSDVNENSDESDEEDNERDDKDDEEDDDDGDSIVEDGDSTEDQPEWGVDSFDESEYWSSDEDTYSDEEDERKARVYGRNLYFSHGTDVKLDHVVRATGSFCGTWRERKKIVTLVEYQAKVAKQLKRKPYPIFCRPSPKLDQDM